MNDLISKRIQVMSELMAQKPRDAAAIAAEDAYGRAINAGAADQAFDYYVKMSQGLKPEVGQPFLRMVADALEVKVISGMRKEAGVINDNKWGRALDLANRYFDRETRNHSEEERQIKADRLQALCQLARCIADVKGEETSAHINAIVKRVTLPLDQHSYSASKLKLAFVNVCRELNDPSVSRQKYSFSFRRVPGV